MYVDYFLNFSHVTCVGFKFSNATSDDGIGIYSVRDIVG